MMTTERELIMDLTMTVASVMTLIAKLIISLPENEHSDLIRSACQQAMNDLQKVSDGISRKEGSVFEK